MSHGDKPERSWLRPTHNLGFLYKSISLSFSTRSLGSCRPCKSQENHNRLSSTLHMSESRGHGRMLPKPSIVFITPDNVCQNIEEGVRLVRAVLIGGTSLVQVRDRNSSPFCTNRFIEGLLAKGIPPQKLVVNGMAPVDVLAIDPGLGVHIKERDIEIFLPEAKRVMPHGSIIGCAIHSIPSAQRATRIHGPSYLQVGTMYNTKSHPGKIPEGPELITQLRGVVNESLMLIGVGGINEQNLSSVIEHGADGIAVISQLSNAEDPQTKSAILLNLCQTAFQSRIRR